MIATKKQKQRLGSSDSVDSPIEASAATKWPSRSGATSTASAGGGTQHGRVFCRRPVRQGCSRRTLQRRSPTHRRPQAARIRCAKFVSEAQLEGASRCYRSPSPSAARLQERIRAKLLKKRLKPRHAGGASVRRHTRAFGARPNQEVFACRASPHFASSSCLQVRQRVSRVVFGDSWQWRRRCFVCAASTTAGYCDGVWLSAARRRLRHPVAVAAEPLETASSSCGSSTGASCSRHSPASSRCPRCCGMRLPRRKPQCSSQPR